MRYKTYKEIYAFMVAVLNEIGVEKNIAHYVSDGLASTSLRGVDSHGIRLFPHYVNALRSGRINGYPEYEFIQKNASTAVLDADHTYGHAAGIEAMNKAISLAETNGTGIVAVKNSTHFGAASYYCLHASNHSVLALSFTNATSLLKSPSSSSAFFGANPICFTAPMADEEPLCLDMATTEITWNKVKLHKERGLDLPPNLVYDEDGNFTVKTSEAKSLSGIGGYKGYGLSIMIDILCSMLTDMPYGIDITDMYADAIEKKRELGQLYMAIKIDGFVSIDNFKRRMQDMANRVRAQEAQEGMDPVMIPGDPEKKIKAVRTKTGIPIEDALDQLFREIGEKYNAKVSY
jgi:ureidoglycolate dehydrogenase (NAD+)